MSLVIETHIICDKCSAPYGMDKRHLKAPHQRRRSKVEGWVYSNNKDYCPACKKSRGWKGQYAKYS